MPTQNRNVDVPDYFELTLSDSVNEAQGSRGFEVWAAGDVKWTTANGFTQTQTFAAPFPVRVTCRLARVWSTGTDLDPDNSGSPEIVGLR